MSIQKIELDVLDLISKKKKMIELKEAEICIQGFRINLDGKIVNGVPHRNQGDCYKFCFKDICDSL